MRGEPVTGSGGLRERKKRETRHALTDAARRLALERGLEHLTVEEISEAANVSPRTFFNYFAGKEQAILGDDLPRVDAGQAAEVLRRSPTVLAGLRDVAVTVAARTGESRERIWMRRMLMERYPVLILRMFEMVGSFEDAMATAVAARTGGSADDGYPRLAAAVAATAMRVAVHSWASCQGEDPLEVHVSEMFGLLREQLLQQPSAPPATGARGADQREG